MHLLSIAGVIVVYCVTFGLLLPAMLYDWPYSAYYSDSLNTLDVVKRVVWVCLFFLCHLKLIGNRKVQLMTVRSVCDACTLFRHVADIVNLQYEV